MTQQNIKGLIFDYGGTIDTNGIHWFEVFYKMYALAGIIPNKETLRKAYIFGEQEMECNSHLVKPEHTFKDNLLQKIRYQANYLIENKSVKNISDNEIEDIASQCYDFASQNVAEQSKVLEKLATKYPLVLVSNFYGNIQSVLKDFGIDQYFQTVIESAKVGVRKPNPEIFRLGLNTLQLNANQVAIIGDSYKNDINPARQLGCTSIWLKGISWNNEEDSGKEADFIIKDLKEVSSLIEN